MYSILTPFVVVMIRSLRLLVPGVLSDPKPPPGRDEGRLGCSCPYLTGRPSLHTRDASKLPYAQVQSPYYSLPLRIKYFYTCSINLPKRYTILFHIKHSNSLQFIRLYICFLNYIIALTLHTVKW